jgi:hypothetical protein
MRTYDFSLLYTWLLMLPVFVFLILQKAQYGAGMEQKHGPDWQAKHTKFDVAVIYDMEGNHMGG